jgi:hypothetical protein
LPAGDAAVAGFSGTVVLGSPPPPEPKRIDKTYINPDGPALRVINLGSMGGPPQAQLVAAPKSITVLARQIGQVFSLALDDADPPNIYAAATSAYGLPIVVPDADGDGLPDRARRGAPNAAFMPGLFGPVMADGGPGSIWKIDGRTGAVTLFANVLLNGVQNSGPALGGLTFDRTSRQLFVADRDTGMVHRFTLDGIDRGQFDHGTQALASAGLPPIAFDQRKRLNIESPAFDSGNPGTWAYAPPARRVFGVAVGGGRLYYAVAAGLRVWSVSILPDGSFGTDARFEVSVPRSASPSAEISEILFDDNGDMLVAERGAPTGAYDYKALAESPENRVLRFRPKRPGDPPSRDLWFPVPRENAIGFPPNFRNDNGGIALGYGYDAAGNINRAVCGGTLWSTGEQLRNAKDAAIIRRLQPGGPLIVDGLQGHGIQLLRPQNEPPFASYFIDYDDRFDDPQARGHLGDVVTWRVCGQAVLPLVPVVLICPPGLFDVDGVCRFPLTCPSGTEFSNGCCGYRDCPASYVRIRGKCVPPTTNCKSGEVLSEGGRCEAPKCPAGMVFVSSDAAAGSGPGGLTAPNSGALSPGALNALEEALKKGGGRDKPKMCSGGGYCKCPEGTQRSEDGTCKKSNDCGPNKVLSDGECTCKNGYVYATDWATCVPTSVCDPATPGGNTAGCCKPGRQWSQASLSCDPPPRCDPSDPTSLVQNNGQCICRDGSSAGQSGGSGQAAGLTGQNCCPTGRRFNAITNKCDPGDPGKPHVTIVKTKPDSCTLMSNDGQISVYQCTFTITLTNDGTAPANIPPVIDTPSAGKIVGTQSDGTWNCGIDNNNTATCQRPSALGPGGTTTFTVTLEQNSYNYEPNPPGVIRGGGGPTEAQNCAEIVTPGLLNPVNPGLVINPGVFGDLGGQSLKSCDRIRLPRNPKDPPPVTMCRMPACSGGTDNPTGRPYCRPGECDCSSGPVGPEGRQLCRPDECMAPCPASSTTPPPLPPPPLPPPPTTSCQAPNFLVNGMCCDARSYQSGLCGGTTTSDCPAGMRRGFNGQCFVVDPGCQGPNCGQVTGGCPGGVARNPDGSCPTPTTTTCPFPKVPSGGKCICRGGTVGDDCHVPKETKKCQQGTHLVGGECVRGLQKQRNKKVTPKSSDGQKLKSGPGLNPSFPGGLNRKPGGGSGGGGGGKGKG